MGVSTLTNGVEIAENLELLILGFVSPALKRQKNLFQVLQLINDIN